MGPAGQEAQTDVRVLASNSEAAFPADAVWAPCAAAAEPPDTVRWACWSCQGMSCTNYYFAAPFYRCSRSAPSVCRGAALVKASPLTGRTHQVSEQGKSSGTGRGGMSDPTWLQRRYACTSLTWATRYWVTTCMACRCECTLAWCAARCRGAVQDVE